MEDQEQQPTGQAETPQVLEETIIQPKKEYKPRKVSRARAKAMQRIAKAKGIEVPIPPIQEKPKRKERVPFGTPRPKLPVMDDPAFKYRVFNDNWRKEPGRIQRAKDAGYEVVQGQEALTVGTNEDGSAIKGVLMRIPREFYEEDQNLKQKEIDKIDAEINRGKYQEKPDDKRYVPSSGIRIETKLTP